MRNLKRALSLALASVMLLGMMVTGASAASYPDVDENDNVEAIEVLKAVGVMVGDEGSTDFRPDDPVTRNEMAVIMALLLKLDYNYYVTSCPFPDVPEWARGWVGACYANGIVSGRSETEYDGSATVTAVEAASMIMRAIGYFKYSSDYEPDFETSTVAQASKLQLFDGVNASARAALTRNQVAQLTLNALETPIVEPDDDTINWTGPDGSTMTMGKVNYVVVASRQAYAQAIDDSESSASGLNQVNGFIVELGEQLYNGDLKKYSDETDNFGAPATRWTYKNNKIGVYADEADYTFEGIVKSSDMYAAVGKTAAEDYEWVVKMDGAKEADAKKVIDADLKYFTQKDVEANDKEDLAGTKRGSTTYVYLDDTGHGTYKGTATVCIVNTYAAEITKVVDETITLGDMDGASLEYDIAGYDEGEVVLYTKSCSNGKDWTVESILGVPELIEGKPDTIRDADRVVMGDTTYRYSYRFNKDEGDKLGTNSVDKDVAFYLDRQGNIVMMADTSALNDYAYVYSIGKASSKYGEDAEFGAKLIFTNGTTRNVDIDTDTTDAWTTGLSGSGTTLETNQLNALRYGKINNSTPASKGQVSLLTTTSGQVPPLEGQIVSYSEDDGLYTLEIETTHVASWARESEDVIKNGSTSVNLTDATKNPSVSRLYTDKNSAILVNTDVGDLDDYDAYTGFDDAPSVDANTGSEMVAYVDDGVVRALYINKANAMSDNDIIFVIGDSSPKQQKTGSETYYNYDAVVNGEVTTLRVRSGKDAAHVLANIKDDQIGIYFGMTEDSKGYVTKLNASIPRDIEVNGVDNKTTDADYTVGNYTKSAYNGVSKANGKQLGFGWVGGNTREFTVRPSAADDVTIVYYDGHDLELSALHTDHNDHAWVITDDGIVTAVFVWEVKGNDAATTPGGSGGSGSGSGSGSGGATTTPTEGPKSVATISSDGKISIYSSEKSLTNDDIAEAIKELFAERGDGDVEVKVNQTTGKVTVTTEDGTVLNLTIDEKKTGMTEDAVAGTNFVDKVSNDDGIADDDAIEVDKNVFRIIEEGEEATDEAEGDIAAILAAMYKNSSFEKILFEENEYVKGSTEWVRDAGTSRAVVTLLNDIKVWAAKNSTTNPTTGKTTFEVELTVVNTEGVQGEVIIDVTVSGDAQSAANALVAATEKIIKADTNFWTKHIGELEYSGNVVTETSPAFVAGATGNANKWAGLGFAFKAGVSEANGTQETVPPALHNMSHFLAKLHEALGETEATIKYGTNEYEWPSEASEGGLSQWTQKAAAEAAAKAGSTTLVAAIGADIKREIEADMASKNPNSMTKEVKITVITGAEATAQSVEITFVLVINDIHDARQADHDANMDEIVDTLMAAPEAEGASTREGGIEYVNQRKVTNKGTDVTIEVYDNRSDPEAATTRDTFNPNAYAGYFGNELTSTSNAIKDVDAILAGLATFMSEPDLDWDWTLAYGNLDCKYTESETREAEGYTSKWMDGNVNVMDLLLSSIGKQLNAATADAKGTATVEFTFDNVDYSITFNFKKPAASEGSGS